MSRGLVEGTCPRDMSPRVCRPLVYFREITTLSVVLIHIQLLTPPDRANFQSWLCIFFSLRCSRLNICSNVLSNSFESVPPLLYVVPHGIIFTSGDQRSISYTTLLSLLFSALSVFPLFASYCEYDISSTNYNLIPEQMDIMVFNDQYSNQDPVVQKPNYPGLGRIFVSISQPEDRSLLLPTHPPRHVSIEK